MNYNYFFNNINNQDKKVYLIVDVYNVLMGIALVNKEFVIEEEVYYDCENKRVRSFFYEFERAFKLTDKYYFFVDLSGIKGYSNGCNIKVDFDKKFKPMIEALKNSIHRY